MSPSYWWYGALPTPRHQEKEIDWPAPLLLSRHLTHTTPWDDSFKSVPVCVCSEMVCAQQCCVNAWMVTFAVECRSLALAVLCLFLNVQFALSVCDSRPRQLNACWRSRRHYIILVLILIWFGFGFGFTACSYHKSPLTTWCDKCDLIWCDKMWCDMMWYDVMWCDVMWITNCKEECRQQMAKPLEVIEGPLMKGMGIGKTTMNARLDL